MSRLRYTLVPVLLGMASPALGQATLSCHLGDNGHRLSIVATNTGIAVNCSALCPFRPFWPNGPNQDPYVNVTVPAGITDTEVWYSIIPQYETKIDPDRNWPIIYTCKAG